jgi:3-ketosteroid 9alpha-monooxygenase subunit B
LSGNPFTEVEYLDVGTDDDNSATVTVTIDGHQHQLRWPRQGAATLLNGEVDMPASEILEPEDIEAGTILGCQAKPVSDDIEVEF